MPWCPKCGYEYKTGYSMCSDCNVELVDKLEVQDDILYSNDIYDSYAEENGDFDELGVDNADYSEDDKNTDEGKYINTKRQVYVEANVRAGEYKLGAVALLIVGCIGIIVILLMNLGIIPFLPAVSKTLMNIVMGGLFIVFIVMGISSIGSYKKMLELAEKEGKLKKDIEDFFSQNVTPEELSNYDLSKLTKEELCLKQYEQIGNIINANFEGIEPDFLDYITEKIYVNMFE